MVEESPQVVTVTQADRHPAYLDVRLDPDQVEDLARNLCDNNSARVIAGAQEAPNYDDSDRQTKCWWLTIAAEALACRLNSSGGNVVGEALSEALRAVEQHIHDFAGADDATDGMTVQSDAEKGIAVIRAALAHRQPEPGEVA